MHALAADPALPKPEFYRELLAAADALTEVAVIDLDSPSPARFDADDQAGIEALAALVAARL